MKIAFVCNGNSFKSIVAERFANEFNNGSFEIYSAGTNPAEVINAVGKEIMERKGYSMDGYSPSTMETLPETLDVLVKMGCDIDCPIHNAEKVIDFGLQDIKDQEKCVELIEDKVKELLYTLNLGMLAKAREEAMKNFQMEKTKNIEDC
jgi:arsenate reductase